MSTTLTPTPRPDDAAIDLRIVRDDTSNTNVVAEWYATDVFAAVAELANWTGITNAHSSGALAIRSDSVRPLPTTAGARYLVETFQYPGDILRAGSTALVSTREVPFTSNFSTRHVAEVVAPTGGFNLVGTVTSGGNSLFGYKVTKLTDQRIMYGPQFPAGAGANWSANIAAPFNNRAVNTTTTPSVLGQWYNVTTAGTVAAGALALSRSIDTTAGRDYVITTEVGGQSLGTSYGLVLEVRSGGTLLASHEVATNMNAVVKLSFTAPGTTVTLIVRNRQPFNVAAGSGNQAYFYIYSLLIERLNSDDLSQAKYTLATLSRTDANGVRMVRLPRGADLTDGVLGLTDYEPALEGLVTYTAVTERVGHSGTREIATTSTRLDRTGNVFTQANTPQLRFNAAMVETYSATNDTSAVFHDVIGRRDPVVSTGVQRLRNGSMRVWFASYEDAREAISVAGRGEPILWRSTYNAGLDMFFIAGSVSSAPYDIDVTPRHWYVDIDFREVTPPTSPIDTDAAWNFGASAERNATFFDSFSEFSTFTELLNGPEVV